MEEFIEGQPTEKGCAGAGRGLSANFGGSDGDGINATRRQELRDFTRMRTRAFNQRIR